MLTGLTRIGSLEERPATSISPSATPLPDTSSRASTGAGSTGTASTSSTRLPPPTPVIFPSVHPRCDNASPSASDRTRVPLVALLQSVLRPMDIRVTHFEALGLHVIPDAAAEDIIPESGFLPPVSDWDALPTEQLVDADEATRQPLGNGNRAPGVKTWRERQRELRIDNTAAFRTVRRIPAPAGETAARLGNTYEFYKHLEFFSGYWPDTSLPPGTYADGQEGHVEEKGEEERQRGEIAETEGKQKEENEKDREKIPHHLKTHVLAGCGAQLPPDSRQQMIAAFVKLVAYDFGCNVAHPRVEPRLHLTPPSTTSLSSISSSPPPPSSFNSSATFVYRTPTDRASARAGIVEGPVAALSSRASTVFATPAEENLDFAREVVAILLTAQQRARENKTERRFGEGKWWTTVPRWGGGAGGPIGREENVVKGSSGSGNGDDVVSPSATPASTASSSSIASSLSNSALSLGEKTLAVSSSVTAEAKRAIGGIAGLTPPPKRSRKTKARSDSGGGGPNTMPMYDNYRRMNAPTSSWDRKARYCAIGKHPGNKTHDDIFLVSALNHHVAVVRARVPMGLLDVLDGAGGGVEGEGWERVVVWRSKWFDLYLMEERVQAMSLLWGVMSYAMRKVDGNGDGDENENVLAERPAVPAPPSKDDEVSN